MIQEKSNIEISNSAAFKTSVAKVTSSAQVMSILRDKIYTDKVMAVLREALCNAIDSHSAANKKDVAVEVYLPNILEPVLRIVDYGLGLDDYGVREVFFSYGPPDGVGYKNKSNEYIGSYGLGSKSFWCYTHVAQVIATKDNIRRTYNAYINEEEIGDIAQLSEEFVDAPNGLEIQVPVKQSDFYTFSDKLAKLLRFNTRPVKVHGVWPEYKDEWLIKGSKWGVIKGDNNSFLVMGGVPYEINASKIDENLLSYAEREILHSGLIIFADIGEVTVAASRESVSYTEKTGKFVSAVCKIVLEEARVSMTDAFAKADTEYKARELYYQYFSSHGRMGKIFKTLVDSGYKPIAANGKEVVSYHFDCTGREVYLRTMRRTYNKRVAINYQTRFCPYGYKVIYYTIGEVKESRLKKQMTQDFFEKGIDNSYIMTFTDQAAYDTFVSNNGFTCPMVDAASIILPKVQRVGHSGSRVYFKAHVLDTDTKAFEGCDIDFSQGGYYVYRQHNKYGFVSGHLYYDSTNVILESIKLLTEKFDLDEPTIYAFTPKITEKLDKTIWIEYGTFIKSKLEEYYKDNQSKVGWESLDNGYDVKKLVEKLPDHPLFSELSHVESYPAYDHYSQVRDQLRIPEQYVDQDEISKINKKISKIMKAYALIGGSRDINAQIEYIKAVDIFRNEKKSDEKPLTNKAI